MNSSAANAISFQGEAGANSHVACSNAYPDMAPLPCNSFEDAFLALKEGQAALAMIPIENSVAGRVADIHHLLPDSGFHIIGEHFERVEHQLLVLPGTKLEDIREVRSHVHALGQCRRYIRKAGITPIIAADTAGSAREISEERDPSVAAIASKLAAEIYKLEILASNIEDAEHNTTRFVVLAREPNEPKSDGKTMMSFVFDVRNVPSALYKALGGFATNGINMVKLESYQLDGTFNATQFYADIEGHPSDKGVQLAFEELEFYTDTIRILGVYPMAEFRQTLQGN